MAFALRKARADLRMLLALLDGSWEAVGPRKDAHEARLFKVKDRFVVLSFTKDRFLFGTYKRSARAGRT